MTVSTSSSHKEMLIGPGTMSVSRNATDVFKTTKLTTGLVIVAYQANPLCAGVLHLVMPESKIVSVVDNPLKYADTAIPEFLTKLEDSEFSLEKGIFLIIGGSQLFNFGGTTGNVLNVGLRNVIVSQAVLAKHHCNVVRTDTGGNRPRTVTVHLNNFNIGIEVPGQPIRQL